MEIRDAVADDLDDLMALNDEIQGIHVSLFPDVFRSTTASGVGDWFRERMSDSDTSGGCQRQSIKVR
jgi:hypothetical protein